MDLSLAVLVSFAVAMILPFLRSARAGVWSRALALLPTILFGYFLYRLPGVRRGDDLRTAYEWVPSLDVSFSLRLDGLSLLMALLITGVGAVVMLYASSYMQGKERQGAFFAYLTAFMGSMLGLVLADNIITLFVFWELTSITSFLLIGIEHDQEDARKAATQALLVTGGGGLALLGGLLLLGQTAGSYELSGILGTGDAVRDDSLYGAILVLILAGALTKSAQFPFHFWLPSAMTAPTPVSAYLHSATMVKAGVYLLARLHPVLGDTDAWLVGLGLFGGVTMVLGAFLATRHKDLKLILAYSTVAALGIMVALLGLGTGEAVKAAIVFLFAHALYKGALFLVAGIIDHETGTRDYTEPGGLARVMPATAAGAFIAAASLAGVAPFLAFIGKEAVLEATLHGQGLAGSLLTAGMVVAGVFFTVAALMMVRPFVGRRRGPEVHHEAPLAMTAGPLLLGGLSVVFGLLPAVVDTELFQQAARAVALEPVEEGLSLWHGVNAALVLSILSIAGGALIFWRMGGYLRIVELLAEPELLRPSWLYDRGMAGLVRVARVQTATFQNGRLRSYVAITLLLTVLLVGAPLIFRDGDVGLSPSLSSVAFYEAAVVAVIVGGAVLAITTDSRLGAVVALGTVGFGVAVIYALFGAPDLAMTQFLVETLTVLLFVLVFYRLPRMVDRSRLGDRLRDSAVAVSVGGLMTVLVLAATNRTIAPTISGYFAENASPAAFGRNVVNVILVDFRALDTLGEIVVLSAAAIGVIALLKFRRRDAL